MAVVLVLTLWPTHTERPVSVPVYDATRSAGGSAVQASHALDVLDLVGNVALYVPLGLLAWLRVRRVLVVTATGALLSAAVEVAQHLWLPGRDGAVRDVVTNGLGALVGALVARSGPGRRS